MLNYIYPKLLEEVDMKKKKKKRVRKIKMDIELRIWRSWYGKKRKKKFIKKKMESITLN